MSSVLYYSNYCDKCKSILRLLGKSKEKDDIHFICIDKRVKSSNGAIYIILENQQKIVLPPQIQKVPAMLLRSF